MTTKLEQAAKNLLSHWDSVSWKQTRPTADFMADLREALADTRSSIRSSIRSTSEYSEQAAQEPVAWIDRYGNVFEFDDHDGTGNLLSPLYAAPQPVQEPVAAKEKLASTNIRDNWYYRQLYEKVGFDADLYSAAGKLALELECLLLDTKDLSVVSKWWDSAHDALEQWRTIKDAAPVRTKDLTDDEIDDFALASGGDLSGNNLVWFSFHDYYKFARAVIAADRAKNNLCERTK